MKVNKKMLTAGVFMGLCLFTMTNVSALEDNVNTDNQEVSTYQVSDDEEIFTGWKEIDGNYYYFDEWGDKVVNVSDYEIDGKSYGFDEEGVMLKGIHTADNVRYRYYDDNTGVLLQDEWKILNGHWHYFDEFGLMQYDEFSDIHGFRYHFDEDGNMTIGWLQIEGSWFYFDESGKEVLNDWKEIDGQWYYFDSYSMARNGDYFIDNVWYGFDENGHLLNGWIKKDDYNSSKYYINGVSANGEITINNKKYLFGYGYLYRNYQGTYAGKYYKTNNEGVILITKSLTNGFNNIDGDWYYIVDDEIYRNKFLDYNGATYYFNYEGKMLQNTSYYDYEKSAQYDFDNDGRMIKNDWSNNYGNWYYHGANGARVTGLQNIGGREYLFSDNNAGMLLQSTSAVFNNKLYTTDKDGVVKDVISTNGDGWKYYKGNYYYVKDGQFVKDQYITENGKTYYLNISYTMVTDTIYYSSDIHAYDVSGAMVKNDWFQDIDSWDSSWYYFDENGFAFEGWKIINGTYYYFDPVMATDVNEINGKYYFFDESGRYLREVNTNNGWNYYLGDWYYVENGHVLTNEWKSDGNTWYYFNSNSRMVNNNEAFDSGNLYYFASNGAMITNQWVQIYGDQWAYALNSGALVQSDWLQLGNDWYYFNGTSMVNYNTIINNKLYYFGTNGKWNGNSIEVDQLNGWCKVYDSWRYYSHGNPISRGWHQIDGSWYYSNGSTIASNDIFNDGSNFYYVNEDCHYLSNGWIAYAGTWLYADTNGHLRSGWSQIDGKWYYFNTQYYNGIACDTVLDCVKLIDDKYYVFDANGALIKEYTPVNGWNLINGTYYYYEDEHFLSDTVKKIGGSYYEFDEEGKMLSNEVGETHIYDKSGAMVMNGWYNLDGKWYYANVNGNLYFNQKRVIDGVEYTFDSTGAMI